jgi:hypothetical protein
MVHRSTSTRVAPTAPPARRQVASRSRGIPALLGYPDRDPPECTVAARLTLPRPASGGSSVPTSRRRSSSRRCGRVKRGGQWRRADCCTHNEMPVGRGASATGIVIRARNSVSGAPRPRSPARVLEWRYLPPIVCAFGHRHRSTESSGPECQLPARTALSRACWTSNVRHQVEPAVEGSERPSLEGPTRRRHEVRRHQHHH